MAWFFCIYKKSYICMWYSEAWWKITTGNISHFMFSFWKWNKFLILSVDTEKHHGFGVQLTILTTAPWLLAEPVVWLSPPSALWQSSGMVCLQGRPPLSRPTRRHLCPAATEHSFCFLETVIKADVKMWFLMWLDYIFKVIVHPKIKMVIIHSPSCHSKPIRFMFIFETQINIFYISII